ncbi:hypothetical protein MW887_010827 [Aspergillus wentii]|nr:hypothetical protein MW887_010827 [Aspergillus wentii]
MPLSTLPPASLKSILSFLDRPSLYNLSLVSKQFHNLAEPFLYTTVEPVYNGNEYTYKSFLRAILNRPELARHVQAFRAFPQPDEEGWQFEPTVDDLKLFLEATSKLKLPDEFIEKLNHGLTIGILDAESTLILCLLPNLETLILDDVDEPELTLTILEYASFDSEVDFSGLSNVKHFITDTKDVDGGNSMTEQYSAAFNIASLKTFKANMPHRDYYQTNIFSPDTSSVESITLVQGALCKEFYEAMIDSCKTLTTFHYSLTRIPFFEPHLTGNIIITALLKHKSTLEDLTISLDEDWDRAYWDDDQILHMGTTLAQFHNLKTLRTGMQSLLGILHAQPDENFRDEDYPLEPKNVPVPDLVDVLPESLERLTILYANAKIVPHLKKLAEAKRHGNLKNVYVSFCTESTEERDLDVHMEGVDFVFEYHNAQQRLEMMDCQNWDKFLEEHP